MRARETTAFFLLLLFLSSLLCCAGAQSPRLFIEVSIDVSTTTVMISGRVLDGVGNNVPQALVSIQVDDPLGSPLHIARMLSGSDGRFSDTFGLNPYSPIGNYTVYFTASKEKYTEGQYRASFRVGGDFVLTIITIWPLFAIGAIVVTVSYLILRNRMGGSRIPYDEEVTEEDLEARRALVELEELRAAGKIDEKEYLQRRRHLEKRLRSK